MCLINLKSIELYQRKEIHHFSNSNLRDFIFFQFTLVLGRSVTFHGRNGSAERIACADIIPEKESDAIFFKLYLQRAKHTNK